MQDSYTLFKEINRKFTDAQYSDVESMEKDFHDLRNDKDYLMNSAVVDFMDLLLEDKLKTPIIKGKSSSDITNIPDFRKKQIDCYINFIVNDIKDGEPMLLSNLSCRRFGYTRQCLKEGLRHEVIENIINYCAGFKNSLAGAIASRVIFKESDLAISKLTNLNAKNDAARFLEISAGRNRLLRVASPKVKHQLASSDFDL